MHPSQPYAATAYEPYARPQEVHGDHPAEKLLNQRPREKGFAGTTRNAMQKEGRGPSKQVTDSMRIALRLLALAFAASVIGVQAHAAAAWNHSRHEVVQDPKSGFRMRAWPVETDLWPTWTTIGAAVIAATIHISSLVTLCGVLRNLRQTRFYTGAVVLTSVFSIIVWIAAVVYYKVDNARGKKHWDIWSWSCTHETFKGSKVHFEPLCVELNYSFYAIIVSAAFEIACLAIFIVLRVREGKQRPYKQIVTVTGSV